ncbi:MAG: GNAT family N-acetyltransferase [Pseudomonadota bacterium]
MIRPAGPADADAAARVYAESYPARFPDAYDTETLAVFMPFMLKPSEALLASGRFYVLEEAGEVVACGGWSVDEPGTGSVVPGLGHIRHLAVLPGFEGRALGRALVERCVSEARATGLTRMMVFASLNAEAFYARVGFTRIGEARWEIGAHALISARMVMDISRKTPRAFAR